MKNFEYKFAKLDAGETRQELYGLAHVCKANSIKIHDVPNGS